MRYKLCDLVIESEIPLAELVPSEGDASPRFTFNLLPARNPQPYDYEWFHQWNYPDGELWSSFARHAGKIILRFEAVGDFAVDALTGQISCVPVPGVPLISVAHILVNQVLPITIGNDAGRIALHASAVQTGAGASAFLGQTGRGKSTLAGFLCQHGSPLVTDDFLLLEVRDSEALCLPSYPGLRVWDDVVHALSAETLQLAGVAHYTEKKRFSVADSVQGYCAAPLLLKHVYLLAEVAIGADEVLIEPIPQRDAVVELTRYTFHLDLSDAARRAQEFSMLCTIAAHVNCWRLTYPRVLTALGRVHAAILAQA